MKRTLTLALVLFASAMSHPALAAEWTGTQLMMPISGELSLTDSVGVRAHLGHFAVPKSGFSADFVYLGPTGTFQFGDELSLWVSPQVTSWHGWFDDQDAFGGSLWLNLSYGDWSLFLEGDYVVSEDLSGHVLYGYYAVDRAISGWPVNIGLHAEQADADVDYGPHISISTGPLHCELQYYADFEDGEYYHAVRMVAGLSFFGP